MTDAKPDNILEDLTEIHIENNVKRHSMTKIETDGIMSRPPAYSDDEDETPPLQSDPANNQQTRPINSRTESNATVPDANNYNSAPSTSNHKTDEKMNFQEGPETVTERDKLLNPKALPRDANTYRLETFKKNAMIIFNHENVEGFSKNVGTGKDVTALRKTFEKFGFEIAVYNDLTKAELFEELKRFSEKDFTEYGCVAVVILTHGTHNGLLRARDEGGVYSEMDIINEFKVSNKPTLVTKPVLLMIQACRGTNSTRGVPVMKPYEIDKDTDETPMFHYLPLESDMLIIHSSFPGKPSFKSEQGSWFIQTLCSFINNLYRTHDLESIITEVKRDIAINKYHMEYNYKSQEMDVKKQMPVVTSTLIRKLFLRKYEDKSIRESSTTEDLKGEKNYGSMNNTKHCSDDSCDILLRQYNYMKHCLRLYINENPKDKFAKYLLVIANLEDGKNKEKTKMTLATITDYLRQHYKGTEYYKYMNFYIPGDTDSFEDLDDMQEVAISCCFDLPNRNIFILSCCARIVRKCYRSVKYCCITTCKFIFCK